jgi:hypothetical protein
MTAADCRSPRAMRERPEPMTEPRRPLLLVQTGSVVGLERRIRNPWQSISVGSSAAGASFWAAAVTRIRREAPSVPKCSFSSRRGRMFLRRRDEPVDILHADCCVDVTQSSRVVASGWKLQE